MTQEEEERVSEVCADIVHGFEKYLGVYMIIIKHHKDGEIVDHRTFPLSARGLSHAIFWLRELRSNSDPYLLLNQEPKSWIEIDGIRIPDSVLFQLSKEIHSSHFLKRFNQDHAKPVTQSEYKK